MYLLLKKLHIQGTITVRTGLVIGGSDTALAIGGLDKTVIMDPADKRPYIPGSSLKGKIRSLLELSEGWVGGSGGGPVMHGANVHPDSIAAQLCGTAITGGKKLDAQNAQWVKERHRKVNEDEQRPSPLIVRDSYLVQQTIFPYADLGYTHTKTEVSLDRITAKANPRTIERVPPGAQFRLDLILNIFQEADESPEDAAQKEKHLVDLLLRGLSLLQDDYLGGNGSRGSGQVDVAIAHIFARDMDWYADPNRNAQGLDCTDKFLIPNNLRSHVPA
jgi:CRISPR-associated protein Csm3